MMHSLWLSTHASTERPHWRVMNKNLIELVNLLPDDKLDWVPRPGEWTAPTIFAHIVFARYFGPVLTPEATQHIGQIPTACKTKDGIKQELRTSWELVENFISDPAKLEAVYEPPNRNDAYCGDEPEDLTGHYFAYHRFAHDLHHRSTIIGYLAELGVPLDGYRIRPL